MLETSNDSLDELLNKCSRNINETLQLVKLCNLCSLVFMLHLLLKIEININRDIEPMSEHVNLEDGVENAENLAHSVESLAASYIPKLGIEFDSEQEAYDFYNNHGEFTGFAIRREGFNKSKKDGVLIWRKFTCCKEGLRRPSGPFDEKKSERAETRADCKAHMNISLDREKNKYVVISVELNHNHAFHIKDCAHMMPSQRKISPAQALEIDLAVQSGIKLKDSYEFMSRQTGGRGNLGFTKLDQKNFMHRQRERSLKEGEAQSLLNYFKEKGKNPSFYYAVQLDCTDHITNIFWADPQMILDYGLFGDVVSFDTTYRTNKNNRPLAVFVGFNHHRETSIFGAALLYDETIDSFRWLFQSFLHAMSGKAPKTIFTDQDAAMSRALSLEVPQTYHRLCRWHLMQNALKHVGHNMRTQPGFKKDLKAFFKKGDEVNKFLSNWDSFLSQYEVQGNDWLRSLFAVKEKWVHAYVRNTFSAGMNTTQLSESINAALKGYLRSDYNIIDFLGHFARVVADKRYKETVAEYNLRQKLPKMKIGSPMLRQAADSYSTVIFLEFQKQYEIFQGAMLKEKSCYGTNYEYVVSIYGTDLEATVTWDSLEKSVSCTCGKFESYGILCCHALKVLDIMEIKVLPEKYIVKRWMKNAKDVSLQDFSGEGIQTRTDLEVVNRYKYLCSISVKVATQAAGSNESFQEAVRCFHELGMKIQNILKNRDTVACTSKGTELSIVPGHKDDLVEGTTTISVKGLKTKEACKGRRRLKSTMEKNLDKVNKKKRLKKQHTPLIPASDMLQVACYVPKYESAGAFCLGHENNQNAGLVSSLEFLDGAEFVQCLL